MEKIAIILEDMRMGGPQKQLLYFLQEVTKSNLKIKYQLIVPKKSKKKLSKFLNLRKINLKEIDINYLSKYSLLNNIIFFIKDYYQIKKAIKDTKKIYIAGGTSCIKSLLVSIFLNKKIYLHIHDLKSNIIIRTILFLTSRYIHKIFFASKKAKQYYNFISSRPKKIILRSSINPNYFKKGKVNKKIFNIGMVANINPDKNFELLIKIIKKINNKNIQFILIGNLFDSQKNYFHKKLNSFLEIKNKLKWYKKNDNPKNIMKSFDMVLCTSKFESFPLSILESLSMSIPVISTDVGDISYLLNKKKCGHIVKAEANEFVNTIYYLKNNRTLMSKYSYNARENIIKNFNINDYKMKLELSFL